MAEARCDHREIRIAENVLRELLDVAWQGVHMERRQNCPLGVTGWRPCGKRLGEVNLSGQGRRTRLNSHAI